MKEESEDKVEKVRKRVEEGGEEIEKEGSRGDRRWGKDEGGKAVYVGYSGGRRRNGGRNVEEVKFSK